MSFSFLLSWTNRAKSQLTCEDGMTMWVVEVSTSQRPVTNMLQIACSLFMLKVYTCKVASNINHNKEAKCHVQSPTQSLGTSSIIRGFKTGTQKMVPLPGPVLEKVQDWQQSPPKGRSPDIEKWKTNLQWFVVSLVVSGKFGLTGIIATTKMNAPRSETCWGSSFDLRSLNILLKSPFFFSHKVLLCSLLILATDFSIKDSAPWSLLSYHVYFVLGDFTFSDTTWLRLHRSFFFSRAAASCPETNKYISLIVSQWCLNHIL